MTAQLLEHRQESSTELSAPAFSDMVRAAHEKAKTLADIVEQAKLYVSINGRKYLQVEAWQTIGRAYGYTAKTGDVQIVRDHEGKELGIMARSVIYDTNGQVVGGAEGYCMNDEKIWVERPFYARAGMAQTRSISRGFRQLVSWVVVLAGYSPTPAEEMTGDERPLGSRKENANLYGLCDIHRVAYFKTEKMRSPAHRTEDGKWCTKPAEKPTPPAPEPRVDLNTGEVLPESPNSQSTNKSSDESTAFFSEAGKLGVKPPGALLILNVKDWNEWKRLGGTLDQAMNQLRIKTGWKAI